MGLKDMFKGKKKNDDEKQDVSVTKEYNYNNFYNGNLPDDYYYETIEDENGAKTMKFIAFRDENDEEINITSLQINNNVENIEGHTIYNGFVDWKTITKNINIYDRDRPRNADARDYSSEFLRDLRNKVYNLHHEVRFGKIDCDLFATNEDYRFCVKCLLEEDRVKNRYLDASMVSRTKEMGNYIGFVGKDMSEEFEYRVYTDTEIGKIIHNLPDIGEKIKVVKMEQEEERKITEGWQDEIKQLRNEQIGVNKKRIKHLEELNNEDSQI